MKQEYSPPFQGGARGGFVLLRNDRRLGLPRYLLRSASLNGACPERSRRAHNNVSNYFGLAITSPEFLLGNQLYLFRSCLCNDRFLIENQLASFQPRYRIENFFLETN
jgi:hypothetical protein